MISLDRMNRRYRVRVYTEDRERRRIEARLRATARAAAVGNSSACRLEPCPDGQPDVPSVD